MQKQPAVYILASQRNGTLYTDVTTRLAARVWQHKNNIVEGFSNRYDIHILVYYELHDTIEVAILREKRIKKWRRKWKIRLIEENNPHWEDLFSQLD